MALRCRVRNAQRLAGRLDHRRQRERRAARARQPRGQLLGDALGERAIGIADDGDHGPFGDVIRAIVAFDVGAPDAQYRLGRRRKRVRMRCVEQAVKGIACDRIGLGLVFLDGIGQTRLLARKRRVRKRRRLQHLGKGRDRLRAFAFTRQGAKGEAGAIAVHAAVQLRADVGDELADLLLRARGGSGFDQRMG